MPDAIIQNTLTKQNRHRCPLSLSLSLWNFIYVQTASRTYTHRPLPNLHKTKIKEMTATSFVSSASSTHCFLPSLPRTQLQHLNFRWVSSSTRNPQRCIAGTRLRISNFYRVGAVGRNLESSGAPTSVPVRVAHELLLAGHRYLDVRTPEEFSAGHASGAINIPYMYRKGSGMTKNPNFVDEVSSHFGKDDEIIVGCQLGKRSLMAAADLLSAGFSGITDIAGGYAAWTQIGLPTEL